MIVAFDLETFYTKRYSVAKIGLDRYVKHPDFRVTLVSIVTEDGFEWVGEPQNLPVERLNGQTLISHNAEFDSVCARAAIFKGQMPEFMPADWICTADMASYHQLPRSLAGAVKELFDEELSKDAREQMAGLSVEEIQSNQTFVNYALEDSRACLRVYQELDAGFPEKERLLSSLTRRIASRGLAIDGPLCQQFIDKTDKILEETPKQTTEWRQANLANQTFEKLLMGQRSDRRVPTRLKYCGAPHTKRWSGGGVINFQAIPNDGIGDISARQCLKAPAGRVLVSADLSQIEPRVIAFLVGDLDFLGLVRGGIDIYEAHGRASKLYKEDEPMAELAPEMRKLCKARLLGLGYGCGPAKFVEVAKSYGVNMTESQAKEQVLLYRAQNPDVMLAWSKMEDQFREWMKETPECITFETRCGVPVRYFNAHEKDGDLYASLTRGYEPVKLYGARLFQNLVQATARSIFADALIRIEAAGLPVCLHVHDSICLEVAEDEGQAALDLLLQLLTQESPNYQGLPLAAEGEIKTHY